MNHISMSSISMSSSISEEMHCSQCEHSIEEEAPKSRWKSFWNHPVVEKIKNIAKFVLIAAVGVALFVSNPFVFTVSFIVGIVADKKVDEVSHRVYQIFKRQPWIVLGVIGVGGFLSLEVTVGAAAVLYAAKLGSYLSMNTREREELSLAR